MIAFLVASPWNSLSLTLLLIALVGLPWTLGFIALSMLVALITGLVFDLLVSRGVLAANRNQVELPADFAFVPQAKKHWQQADFNGEFFRTALVDGLREARMVVRWILFGVLLAAALQSWVPEDIFSTYFGPTFTGLLVTLGVATILEVCSGGSTPLAADILNRAEAPGNGFAFLMGGVATDYTEIMVLKDTMGSLKSALFLPLITVPQVLLLGWLVNQLSV